MEIQKLKSLIHQGIDNTDDVDVLQKVKFILDQKTPEIPVSPETRKRLDKAKKQVREGNFYTNEEANKIMEEWKRNRVDAILSLFYFTLKFLTGNELCFFNPCLL